MATTMGRTGKDVEVLRVAASSNPGSVAGSIMHNYNKGIPVSLIAVGAGALNQAVKATIIARSWVAQKGRNLYISPGFADTQVNDVDGPKNITAITLLLVVE